MEQKKGYILDFPNETVLSHKLMNMLLKGWREFIAMLDITAQAKVQLMKQKPSAIMKTKRKIGMIGLKWSIFILCYFLVKDNEDESSVNRPRSSSKLSKQPPPTYYKDKYRHLLGSDSGKDAAKATKSNSAYGYGKCTVK